MSRAEALGETVRKLERERLHVAGRLSIDRATRLADLDALIMWYELEKLRHDSTG